MSTSRKPERQPSGRNDGDLPPSGFELRLDQGRAFVEATGRPLAEGLTVRRFSMEVPALRFPFDVTGGADRFRDRRCVLRELELVVEATALGQLATRALELGPLGLDRLEVGFRPGGLELLVRQSAAGPVTFKVGIEPDGSALSLPLHELRLYRPAPLCAALLLHRLSRAVPAPRDEEETASPVALEPGPPGVPALRLDPLPAVLRALLVTRGFKLPDAKSVRLASVEVAAGSATLGFRAEGPALPAVAELLGALEGGRRFAEVEALIAEGELARARKELLASSASGPPHPFAAERLLQILAADPAAHDLALDLCALWRQWLPGFPPALWVEAGLRRAAEPLRAARLYLELADQALVRRELFAAGAAAGEAIALARAAGDDELGARALGIAQAARPEDPELLVATAEVAERRGDLPLALSALRRVAAFSLDDERSGRAHARLGRLFLEGARDLPRARLHLDRALEIDPEDRESLLLLAGACEEGGEELRALRLLDRAQKLSELAGERAEAAALALRSGRIWEERVGHGENALLRYREAAEAFREFGDAREVEAVSRAAPICERLGRWAEAVELRLAQAERTPPGRERAEALLAISRALSERLGAPRAAELNAARALESDPGFPDAALELCRLRRGGPPEPLREALATASRLSEGSLRAGLFTELGELELRALGDVTGSLASFEEALRLEPRALAAARGLAEAAERQGEPGRLARALERLAPLEPDPADRARCQRRLMDLAERLKAPDLIRSLEDEPAVALDLLERMRLLHRAAGDGARAAELTRRVAARRAEAGDRPGAAVLLVEEAEAGLGRGDTGVASALLSQASELAPGAPAVLDLAVEVAARLGDDVATRSALLELLAAMDERREPLAAGRSYLRLADVCGRLGREGEAVEALEAAARIDPEPERALERLAAVHLAAGRRRDRALAIERLAELAERRGQDAASRWIEAAELLRIEDPDRAAVDLERAAAGDGAAGAEAARMLAELWKARGDGRRELEALWRFAERLRDGAAKAAALEEIALRAGGADSERAVRLAVEADPDRLWTQAAFAGIALGAGDPAAALAAARRALGTGPRLPEATELFCEAVAAAAAELVGDEGALAHVERLVELEPGETHWLERRVAILRARGDAGRQGFEGALRALASALPGEEAVPLLRELARLRGDRGDGAGAADALLEALERSPEDLQSLEGALEWVSREPLARRISLLRRRARLSPAPAPALAVELAELLELSGDPGATEAWLRAAECSPDDGRVLARSAEALERDERIEAAAEAWRRAASLGRGAGSGVAAAIRAARIELRLGRLERAAEDLAPALDGSESAEGFELLAELFRLLARPADEAAALQRVAALRPRERTRLAPRLAEARRACGDREGEREALSLALEARPSDGALLGALRDCCLALEDWEGACDALEALSRDRSDPSAALRSSLDLAALASDRLSHVGRATSALRRALSIDPKSSAAHERLGEILVARGDVEAGLDHLSRACEPLPPAAAARARARVAERARALGAAEVALAEARAALELGDDPLALSIAVEALYLGGSTAELLPFLERLAAASLDPEPDADLAPEAVERYSLWLADAREAVGDGAGARAALLALLERRPACATAALRLCEAVSDLEPDAAASLLLAREEDLAAAPLRATLLEAAARRLSISDPALAASIYRRAEAALPSASTRAELRRCLDLAGDVEALSDAWIDEIEKARHSDDWSGESAALQALAEERRRAGDAEGRAIVLAELSERAAARGSPSLALEAIVGAAKEWQLAGRHEEALEAQRRAVVLGGGGEALRAAVELARAGSPPAELAELLEAAAAGLRGREEAATRLELADLAAGPLEDLPRAERELRRVLELLPEGAEEARESRRQAGERLCALWIRTGRRAEAGRWLAERARAEGDPDRAAELFERAADELLAGGEPRAAAETLLELPPERGGAARLERVADAVHEEGAPALAARLYERLIDRPGLGRNDRALERCAEALRTAADPRAFASFLEARAAAGPAPARWFAEAASLWGEVEAREPAGDARDARRRCERRAFALSPEDPALFATVVGGLDRAEASDWQEILGLRARAVPAEAPGLHRTVGEVWLSSRRPDEAAVAFEAALATSPDDLLALAGRAEAAFARGEPLEPWARRVASALQAGQRGAEGAEAAFRVGALSFQEGAYALSARLLEGGLELGAASARQSVEPLRLLEEIAVATGDRAARLSARRRLWRAAEGEERERALDGLLELLEPDDPDAVAILSEAVVRMPERAELAARLAAALERAGDAAALCELLERRASSAGASSADASGWALRAADLALTRLGDPDRARRDLEAAVGLAQGDAELSRAVARAAAAAPPAVEDAVLRLLLGVVAESDRPELVIRRARLAEAAFGPDEAARAWDEVVALGPGAPGHTEALERRLRRELEAGRGAEALATQLALAAAAPRGPPRAHWLQEAAKVAEEALGDVNRAIELLRTAAEDADDARGYTLLGEALDRAGRTAEAARALAVEISRREPGERRSERSLRLGYLLAIDLGQPREALPHLLAAWEGGLADARLYEAVADCAAAVEDPALELRALEALGQGGDGRRARRLAELLEGAGRDAEAIEAWQRAFRRDPLDATVADGFERLLETRKRWEELAEALELRASALAAHGGAAGEARAELLCRRAALLAGQLGDPRAAEAAFRDALALVPGYVPALSALAAICEARGATADACELIEREIEIGGPPRRLASLWGRVGDLRRDLGDLAAAERAYRAAASSASEGGDGALAAAARLRLAAALLQTARPDEALAVAEAAVATGLPAGDAPEGHALCARAAAALGQLDRAWGHWKDLLEARPGDPAALAGIDELLRGRAAGGGAAGGGLDPARVAELLAHRAAGERDRERKAELLFELSEVRRRELSDDDGSEAALRDAVAAWPDGQRAMDELSARLESAGRIEALSELLRERSRRAASEQVRSRTLRELGELLRTRLRDLRGAAEAFSRALELDPRDPLASEGLAETLWSLGEPLRAEPHYRRALGGGGHLGEFFLRFRLGQIAMLAARPTEALAELERCVEGNPAFLPAREELASVATALGRFDVARVALLGIVETLGSSPEFAEQLGDVWWRLGELEKRLLRFEAAIEAFERSVEQNGGDPRPLGELARLYEQRGQWPEAVRALRRFAELTQGSAAGAALVEAGILLLDKLADMSGAAEALERALELVPSDARAIERLAEVCEAVGRRERLVELAEAALASRPPDGPEWLEAHLSTLADACEAMGRWELAHWAARKLVQRAGPTDIEALERLARIAGRLGRAAEQLELEERVAARLVEERPLEAATRLRALARRALDRLSDPVTAERLLVTAERLAPARLEDRRLLADLQRQRPDAAPRAVEAYLEVLRSGWPPDPSLLRQLGATAALLDRAELSRASLGLAGAMAGDPPPPPPAPRPLPRDIWIALPWPEEPLAELLRNLAPQLERLFSVDAGRLGLGEATRIGPARAPHVAEALVELGSALGCPVPEAHLAPGRPSVFMECTQPRSLLVGGAALAALPIGPLRFLIAQRMAAAELGLLLPLKFSHRDLSTLALLLAAFLDDPGVVPPSELARLRPFLAALGSSCPAPLHARLAPVGRRLAAGLSAFDPARFVAEAVDGANRLALWATGDLAGGLAAIGHGDGEPRPSWDGRQGRALVGWAFSDEGLRLLERGP